MILAASIIAVALAVLVLVLHLVGKRQNAQAAERDRQRVAEVNALGPAGDNGLDILTPVQSEPVTRAFVPFKQPVRTDTVLMQAVSPDQRPF